jgi:hypothetical protein
MRSTVVVVLCVISAAAGAGIDHYWDRLPSLEGLWEKLPSLARSNTTEPEQTTAKHSGVSDIEVLGDRVRCDVLYQELKIPESEYRSFFDKCMGSTGTTKQSE